MKDLREEIERWGRISLRLPAHFFYRKNLGNGSGMEERIAREKYKRYIKSRENQEQNKEE